MGRVQAGAPLMTLIALNQVWVDANFKESQLRNIRIGQPVTLTADLYGKRVEYKGTVAGLSSIFSGNSPKQVRDVYEKMLKLQASAIPFDILTGKRKYTDMLIKTLSVITDKSSENLLMVTAVCQQVIIVKTALASVAAAPAKQADKKKTASPIKTGLQQLQSGSLFSAVKAGAGFVKKGISIVKEVKSIIT